MTTPIRPATRRDPGGGALHVRADEEPAQQAGCAAHDGFHPVGSCDLTKQAEPEPLDDASVHGWFGLSYANYAVQPRTLLQSMPAEWQRRFVACLQELDDAFEHVEQAPGYEVTPCRWEAPEDVADDVLVRLGFGFQGGDNRTYYDRDGSEVEDWQEVVPVPVRDPVPHYNRGRTRVPLREES